jgi:hypothetical protein
LRKAYFAIRKCNYEFVRPRDLGEKFRAEADTPEKEQRIGAAWHATTNQAFATMKALYPIYRAFQRNSGLWKQANAA